MTGADFPGWVSIPALLAERAVRDGDREAVVDGETRLTYADLAARARAFGRGLLALGVRPGDRIPLWASNSVQWVIAAYGIWLAGASVVPISTRLKGLEAGELLERLNARTAVVEPWFHGIDYLALVDKHYGRGTGRPFDALPDLQHVVLLAPSAADDDPRDRRDGWLSVAELAEAGSAVSTVALDARVAAVGPGDVAEILFTSGTTGVPKGVVLEHGQLLRSYWDWTGIAGIGPGDRYPGMAPFSHGFGINGSVLGCVIRAAANLPVAVFDATGVLHMIESERATVLAGVPALFSQMLASDELPKVDTSSLRVALVGAAAVPTELIRRMRDELGITRVINAYGLIEGCVVSMTRNDDPDEVVAQTSGRPLPGVEVRLAGPSGTDVPAGSPGEVLVRGFGVMREYLDAPALTADTIDDKSWLHTGDIGVLDDNGNLRIVDRLKDMVIVGGFNVYPAEVEALLSRHPEAGHVAVVGTPDERLGEVPVAYVVPTAQAQRAGLVERLTTWAKENMASYKRPRVITVVDALPLNPSGKVDKVTLRKRTTSVGGEG